MTSAQGEGDQAMHRHDVQEPQRLSPQDISKWKGIWQTVKDDYKEGIVVYRILPNLQEPGIFAGYDETNTCRGRPAGSTAVSAKSPCIQSSSIQGDNHANRGQLIARNAGRSFDFAAPQALGTSIWETGNGGCVP